jgi:hypothetical protein
VERYRLAADGMNALVGFLSVIAVELLQLTYLHRTQSDAKAIELLNPLQLQVLKARSPKLPKVLTVAWAVEAIAHSTTSSHSVSIHALFRGSVGLAEDMKRDLEQRGAIFGDHRPGGFNSTLKDGLPMSANYIRAIARFDHKNVIIL